MKMRRVSVAWLNLLHERTRLIVAIAGVAFAVLLIFMNLGFLGALTKTTTNFYRQFNADIFLSSPETLEISSTTVFPVERLYQSEGVPGVKRAMPLYSGYTIWRNPDPPHGSRAMFIYGYNLDDPVFLMPEFSAPDTKQILQQPNVVFYDRLSRPEFGPSTIGSTTETDRRQVTIGGNYSLGGGFAADGTLIMSDQNFVRYLSPRPLSSIDTGLIQLEPGANPERVAKALREALPDDVEVFTKAGIILRDQTYWITSTSIGFIFGLGVLVSFIVGIVIVYQILYTDIRDHLGEYATMKAMGYRNRYLFQVVLQEAMLLAGMGYVPGLIVSLGLYELTRRATAGSLPVSMDMGRVVFVLLLTILMCSVSGLISVRKAVSTDPAEVF
ncbi:MAG: ABC transporter permease DevC [Cyanobacteria bacterium P01_F01_bin.53]